VHKFGRQRKLPDFAAGSYLRTPRGCFRVTAVPSADWRGDDQVAWLIEVAGVRAMYCGDTIWHGRWYELAARVGPLDLAFLPINGVLVRLDGYTPTDVPATLTPEQAVEAAVVLQARTACAIHHGLFDNPPRYREQPSAVARFLDAGSAEASQQPRRTTVTLSSAEVGQSGRRPARATVQDHHYAPTTQPIALPYLGFAGASRLEWGAAPRQRRTALPQTPSRTRAQVTAEGSAG
jgi:L-ascorbate metabolism protein UlaG (beta-lactamase superfamily)